MCTHAGPKVRLAASDALSMLQKFICISAGWVSVPIGRSGKKPSRDTTTYTQQPSDWLCSRAKENMPIVVISPHNVVEFPQGGGHFWVYNAICPRAAPTRLRRLLAGRISHQRPDGTGTRGTGNVSRAGRSVRPRGQNDCVPD